MSGGRSEDESECVAGAVGGNCVLGERINLFAEEIESENEETQTSEANILSPKLRTEVLEVLQKSLGNMYKDEVLTDLQVKVEGQIFKCHRVIMAAISGYFHSLLLSGMKESQNGELDLKNDVTKKTFRHILDYVYSGEDVIDDDTVEELLKAAVFLQIKPLEEHCVEFLQHRLSSANCISTWKLSKTYECPRLVDTSLAFILQRFEEVACIDEFKSLDKDELVALLEDSELDHTNEDPICRAVLDWTKADLETREKHLNDLLDYTCLPKVSGPFMFDLVADQAFLKRSDRYRDSVMDALRYHFKPDERASIMARQACLRNDPDFQKVAVLIGGHYIENDPLRTMLCLDLKTNKWYSAASIVHEPGEDFATCVHKNEIYLSGGSRSLDKFVKYNPMNNDWIEQPSLMTGRECHAMVELDNVIYVLGGQNSTKDEGNSIVEDVEAYDLTTGTWSKAGKLQYPLESLSAVAINNKIYTFGGTDDKRETSSAIQCFDPATGSCTLEGSLPKPTALPVVATINPNVYIICSEGIVYRFDQTLSVSKVATFDARSKFGVYVEGSKLMLLGGEKDNSDLSDAILQIDVRSGSATQSAVKLNIPFGGFKMEHLVMPKSLLIQEGFNVHGQNLFDPDLEIKRIKRMPLKYVPFYHRKA